MSKSKSLNFASQNIIWSTWRQFWYQLQNWFENYLHLSESRFITGKVEYKGFIENRIQCSLLHMGFLLRDPLVVVHKVDLHIRICKRKKYLFKIWSAKSLVGWLHHLKVKRFVTKFPWAWCQGKLVWDYWRECVEYQFCGCHCQRLPRMFYDDWDSQMRKDKSQWLKKKQRTHKKPNISSPKMGNVDAVIYWLYSWHVIHMFR